MNTRYNFVVTILYCVMLYMIKQTVINYNNSYTWLYTYDMSAILRLVHVNL